MGGREHLGHVTRQGMDQGTSKAPNPAEGQLSAVTPNVRNSTCCADCRVPSEGVKTTYFVSPARDHVRHGRGFRA